MGINMKSLWRQQTGQIKLANDGLQDKIREAHWDVVVIGAGMAGILTAYYLQRSGKRVLVVEAKTIASGQTEGTTAKITSQHGLKYAKLIKNIGEEKAKLYALANEKAISQYEKLMKEKEIDCQFQRADAYLYSTIDELELQKEADAAKHLGMEAEFVVDTELPFLIKGGVRFLNQAQFSPLEFIKEITKELNICEHTLVTEVKEHWVITNKGILTADNIVIATHYPIKNWLGFYFLRQHQERSYVLALSGCNPIKHMYYGIDENGLSFRQAGEYLLLGGGGHRTGQIYGEKEMECHNPYEFLRKEAKKYFPEAKEVTYWSAQDCMPHDGVPFIGKYSIFTPHLYVATGFQKWGMTSSMIAARIISDEICGKENIYKEVFTPQRFFLKAGFADFWKDVGISTKGMIQGITKKKRCTHMGCKLEWNETEQSWDCPCHGSRYDADGNLLDNPAKRDLKE